MYFISDFRRIERYGGVSSVGELASGKKGIGRKSFVSVSVLVVCM